MTVQKISSIILSSYQVYSQLKLSLDTLTLRANYNNSEEENFMKIKYFATLAAASILSVGMVTGCANPCGAKTKDGETTEEANPCAGKENPCAGKENPCAGKENPCASKENPCAAKDKGNPCAAKEEGN